MNQINERFDNQDCGPSLKTLTIDRLAKKDNVIEVLVDSQNNKITFFKGIGGFKDNNFMKSKRIKSQYLPNKLIELDEKGEYIWNKGEWKNIKNFIKIFNIFN